MSFSTIARAAADVQLQVRIQAAVQKEIQYDSTKGTVGFGQMVAQGTMNWLPLYWQVAVASEAAYASAVQAGRGAPGHDVDVVTDGQITSAVVAFLWPVWPLPEEPEE